MLRTSVILGFIGLLLLIASFTPWPADASATIIASPQNTPVTAAELAEKGRALFLAKGCATCHRHDDVGRQPNLVEVGPTLTQYVPDEAFVRRWLRDPQAVRPATVMPNLALDEDEIDALTAFLAAP